MVKRTENVVLLKTIGAIELVAGISMIYFFRDETPALIGGVVLLGLAANSFYQAHKCYKRQYAPKKED